MNIFSFETFTETNSPWPIYESIKDLEIRTSLVFNLIFPNNTIFSCFLFFLFIIILYFLIPEIIAEMFILTEELVISTLIPVHEANAEIETQPVIIEARIGGCTT